MNNRYRTFDSVLDEQDYIELQLPEDKDFEDEDFEDDGQPDEYTEWQDYMGGDNWDHGQYDYDHGSDY